MRPESADALLTQHLKKLKLPAFRREYEKVVREYAREGVDHRDFLLRLTSLEVRERERRRTERLIRDARLPVPQNVEAFDIAATLGLDKGVAVELARGNFVNAGENIILLGSNEAGKIDLTVALGLAACRRGLSVTFVTAADLAHRLQQASEERRVFRLLRHLAEVRLLIIDELGQMPLSQAGAALLFEVLSRRHERSSTIVLSKLPLEEWTSVFGSECLTGVLLDRLTHRAHILEMNGIAYCLTPPENPHHHRLRQADPAAEQQSGDVLNFPSRPASVSPRGCLRQGRPAAKLLKFPRVST